MLMFSHEILRSLPWPVATTPVITDGNYATAHADCCSHTACTEHSLCELSQHVAPNTYRAFPCRPLPCLVSNGHVHISCWISDPEEGNFGRWLLPYKKYEYRQFIEEIRIHVIQTNSLRQPNATDALFWSRLQAAQTQYTFAAQKKDSES